MRVGTLIAGIGLGTAIAFAVLVVFVNEKDIFMVAGLGLITFFIGLSFIINGMLLTVPKKDVSDKSKEADTQRELDSHINQLSAATNELVLPESNQVFSSVIEDTTQHLKEKQPVLRR